MLAMVARDRRCLKADAGRLIRQAGDHGVEGGDRGIAGTAQRSAGQMQGL